MRKRLWGSLGCSRPFFGQFVPGKRDISPAKSETGSERASQRGVRGRAFNHKAASVSGSFAIQASKPAVVKSVGRAHSREGVRETRGGSCMLRGWRRHKRMEGVREAPLPLGYKRRTRREKKKCHHAQRRNRECKIWKMGRAAWREGRGGMAVRGNVCFYPTCLLLVLKTGAWHRHFKWMKVTVRVT